MCGIFGVLSYDKDISVDRATSSLNLLAHRGPDGSDHYMANNAFVGHTRLSINDLSSNGAQPMSDDSGKIIITVNGEIYNFLTLRNELKGKYKFKSQSDSEVILYGYMEWGLDELVEKIDGMYAISIYDKVNFKLHIVRDRVGIKPLYYGIKEDFFFLLVRTKINCELC